MINLLNPTDIRELKAARVNVRLRRSLIVTIATLGVIGGIYTFSFYSANAAFKEAVAKSKATEENLKDYETVKATAKTYQANLDIAKKIMGGEVTFSTFITELASALPPNTVLQNLNFSTKSIGSVNGKPITTQLTARAKGYSDVIALKTNLEKKTGLFSEVRISSTSLTTTSTTEDVIAKNYPYTVVLNVTIAPQGGK